MAKIIPNYSEMDGMEVLLYLVKHEPFFWGIIALGIVIALACVILDITSDKNDHYPY